MKLPLTPFIGLAAMLLWATPFAQTVADPTRPMASLLGEASPAKPSPRGTGVPAVASPAASAIDARGMTPRLQSIQLSAPGSATALLDGRVVRVGDRLGDFSITAIDAQGLTLRGPRGEQRLSLLSGVTKTASRATPEPRQALAKPKESP